LAILIIALWFTCSQTLTNYSKLFGFPNHMTLSVNDGHSKKFGGYKPATDVKNLHFCLHIDVLFDMIDTFFQPTLKGSWFSIIPFHIKKINSIE
jgi:hypothetical protein